MADIVLVDPFTVGRMPRGVCAPYDDGFVFHATGVEVDKDTLVVSPVYEKTDLHQILEDGKEYCGLDYMKKRLRMGLAKPEDFYDDGKLDGVDLGAVPETPHDAARISEATQSQLASLAKYLGLEDGREYTADQLEAALVARVKADWAAAQVKPEGEITK